MLILVVGSLLTWSDYKKKIDGMGYVLHGGQKLIFIASKLEKRRYERSSL